MSASTVTIALITMLVATSAYAKGVPLKEERPGLLRKAKITARAATKTARAEVPNGTIVSAEMSDKGKNR